MKWDDLPREIQQIILYYRKMLTCGDYAAILIISGWKCYKTRVFIGRFI